MFRYSKEELRIIGDDTISMTLDRLRESAMQTRILTKQLENERRRRRRANGAN